MTRYRASLALAGLVALVASTAAVAQSGPMSEVIGQPIQATTNGVTNMLYFDADGTVRIVTPNSTVVRGTWAMQGSNLCIAKDGVTECWPYSTFQAQQPKTMTSSCNSVTTWLATATNGEVAPSTPAERGR